MGGTRDSDLCVCVCRLLPVSPVLELLPGTTRGSLAPHSPSSVLPPALCAVSQRGNPGWTDPWRTVIGKKKKKIYIIQNSVLLADFCGETCLHSSIAMMAAQVENWNWKGIGIAARATTSNHLHYWFNHQSTSNRDSSKRKQLYDYLHSWQIIFLCGSSSGKCILYPIKLFQHL